MIVITRNHILHTYAMLKQLPTNMVLHMNTYVYIWRNSTIPTSKWEHILHTIIHKLIVARLFFWTPQLFVTHITVFVIYITWFTNVYNISTIHAVCTFDFPYDREASRRWLRLRFRGHQSNPFRFRIFIVLHTKLLCEKKLFIITVMVCVWIEKLLRFQENWLRCLLVLEYNFDITLLVLE